MSGLTAALWGHSLVYQATPAIAHGAKIEVVQQAVEIVATFDTGEPMAAAQVSVYAPGALDAPWQTGQTDSEGRFLFTPDAAVAAGDWEVTVRKAGHGQTTTFWLDSAEGGAASQRRDQRALTTFVQPSMAQKWVSIAAIIWGFVGTALYFSAKGQRRGTGKRGAEAVVGSQSSDGAAKTIAASVGSDR
ncbi:MAG: carboxypeptidase-like regulatory domain-containing protein [Phormidesmis sp.]